MPGNLSFLPGCELRIELFQRLRGLRLEPIDLVAHSDGVSRLAHCTQFFDLGLEFGHRFFEVEITTHWVRAGLVSGRTDAGIASKSSKRVNLAFTRVFG